MATVLIVDKTGVCIEALRAPLQACGLEVLSVTDHGKAIQVLLRGINEPVDLVILNIGRLPQKGLDWLHRTTSVRLKLGLFADRVLCIATPFLDPHLELEIEASGARVVYED